MAPRKAKVTAMEGDVLVLVDTEEAHVEAIQTAIEEALTALPGGDGLTIRFLVDADTDSEEDEEEEEADEEEEEEESEEDEEEGEGYSEEELTAMGLAELKELAAEYDVDPLPRGKAKIVAAILEAQEEDGDDEEEDEDEEEESEDDDEVLDEDALNAMSLAELRALAKEYDIKTVGLKKDALVEVILEAAGEEE